MSTCNIAAHMCLEGHLHGKAIIRRRQGRGECRVAYLEGVQDILKDWGMPHDANDYYVDADDDEAGHIST